MCVYAAHYKLFRSPLILHIYTPTSAAMYRGHWTGNLSFNSDKKNCNQLVENAVNGFESLFPDR